MEEDRWVPMVSAQKVGNSPSRSNLGAEPVGSKVSRAQVHPCPGQRHPWPLQGPTYRHTLSRGPQACTSTFPAAFDDVTPVKFLDMTQPSGLAD